MPVGKVQWYDADRGFGFVTNPGEEDVYVGRQVLPQGVTELFPGQRIEYEFFAGRRGPQATSIKILDEGLRRVRHQYTPQKLASLVQDTITMLDSQIVPGLQSGRRPDRREGRQISEILRTIARELES